jgi:hypothetical protein
MSSAAEKLDSIFIWRSRWIFMSCAPFSAKSQRDLHFPGPIRYRFGF